MADGILTVLPKDAGGGAGDIITKETFTDFILKADFRLTDAANSGIKYFFDPKVNGGTARVSGGRMRSTRRDQGA